MRQILKPKPPVETVELLKESLGINTILAQLLAQRGVNNFQEAKHFFRPQLSDLHDPLLMADMEVAVNRILQALEEEEKILIYGDYDVDGTTSVAMLYHFFQPLTNNLKFYIPDRYKEGYGVSKAGMDYAKEENVKLIITVDCGIRALEMTNYAHELDMELIICDHHQPGKKLPQALAVLDPKRKDCNYPFKELSGCGVAFKLIQALANKINIKDEEVYDFLDFVTLSIAADIVPIIGENRTLAYYGLKKVQENPRLSFQIFLGETQHTTIENLVFNMAPKINAAGRMEHANRAVEVLITDDLDELQKLSERIKNLNTQRKSLDAQVAQEAKLQFDQSPDQEAVVVYNESWNKGVVGIVASKLVEHYYKPSVVFTKSEDKTLVASARSVPNFDLFDALSQCSEVLDKFGGHMHAAGLSLQLESLEKFKTLFNKQVAEKLSAKDKIPFIDIDLELELSEITPKFLRILDQFAPFGPKNMSPVFITKNLRVTDVKIIGSDRSHIRFSVYSADNQSNKFTCIGFKMAHLYSELMGANSLDLVYSIQKNFWKNTTTIQFVPKWLSCF